MTSTSPPEPPAKPPRLRRWLVRTGFILACLVTLIVALYLEEKIRGRAAWRVYETEARQRGVKLDFADYLPPKISDAENFASIPIFDAVFRASDANEIPQDPFKSFDAAIDAANVGRPMPSAPLPSAPLIQKRIDLAAWQKFFVEAKLLPTAGESAAADVLKVIDTYAAPLAQLREAGTRPHCRFPVHWEKLYAARLPHLGILRIASQLYALRLSAHLALGQSEAAYEDFRDGLHLTTATFEDPSLISGLVRIAMASIMENAVWDGLAGRQWAEPELRKIEADLAALDWLKDYLFAMGSERGFSNLMTEMLIENPRQLAEIMRIPGSVEQPPPAFAFALYPAGWFYQSKVRSNHFFDEIFARIDAGQRRYFGERPIPSSANDIRSLPQKTYYMIFAYLAPALEHMAVGNRYVQTASVTDLARLACALERCRLARGAFPQALTELTPDFLATLPAEIVSGKPYHYRRTEDGSFVLYSVGLDLRDDGGIINLKKPSKGQADWVWQYPAP